MSKTTMSKNEIEQKIRDLKTKLSCQESDIGDWKIAKCKVGGIHKIIVKQSGGFFPPFRAYKYRKYFPKSFVKSFEKFCQKF